MRDRRANRGGDHNQLQEDLEIWEEETKGANNSNSNPNPAISRAPEKADSNSF